jgi:hypothetical protein
MFLKGAIHERRQDLFQGRNTQKCSCKADFVEDVVKRFGILVTGIYIF